MTTIADKAVLLHKQGFNCSQAVGIAFSDRYNIDEKTMSRLCAAFGGGIGRQQLTCGAVLAMCVLVGLEEGNSGAEDKGKIKHCYELTRRLCGEFQRQYGSTECKDIIGITPCSEKVRLAAHIFEQYLMEKEEKNGENNE